MALEGEFHETLESIKCMDCNSELPVKVLQSGAGWYLGRFCDNCGPYERISGYFATESNAGEALNCWIEGDPINMRNTDFHPERGLSVTKFLDTDADSIIDSLKAQSDFYSKNPRTTGND